MLIEGNTFLNSPQAGDGYAISIASTRKEGSDIRHRNITIRRNRIVSPNKCGIYASAVDGLVIQDNVLEGGTRESLLIIKNCNDIREEGNTYNA
jgi:hypothetical protein